MTIDSQRTDDWISHLAFAAPRPSAFGPVDGTWFGMLSVTGDASGGVIGLTGNLSAARKTDWIYILGGWSVRGPIAVGALPSGYVEFQTGPKIVGDGAGIDRPTFTAVGDFLEADNAADLMLSLSPPSGAQPFVGMPLYADPALAGAYRMYHVSYQLNSNTALHTASVWGFLIRPQSFFRGVAPALA